MLLFHLRGRVRAGPRHVFGVFAHSRRHLSVMRVTFTHDIRLRYRVFLLHMRRRGHTVTADQFALPNLCRQAYFLFKVDAFLKYFERLSDGSMDCYQ